MASELPVGWREAAVGDIADVVGGGTPKTSVAEYWGEEIGWLTPKDLRDHGARYISHGERSITSRGLDESAARLLQAGTVLVSSRAPIGYVAIAARPLATNQGFKSLVLKQGYVPEFYYYVMRTKTPEMEAVAGGSTFKEISGRVMKTIPVPVPPIEEQRAIAEVLGALDDRIEWCAGAVGRLEAQLLELARGEAAVAPVADLAAYVNGGAYTKHATGSGRLVIRIAELSSGVGPSSKYAEIDAPPERTAYPGDILFSWSATLDAYRWTADEAVVNQHIFKVLPSEPWPAWLVYAKLKEAMPIFKKIAHDRATTMGHIKRGHLEQVSVGLPDETHLEQVCDLGDALWGQHLRASREQLHLANLRDMLLPRLLSGELRIEDPARVLEAVA